MYNDNVVVLLNTRRSCYNKESAMKESMTVGEMIDFLSNFDEDTKIIFCNDNGYTYGEIFERDFNEIEVEEN